MPILEDHDLSTLAGQLKPIDGLGAAEQRDQLGKHLGAVRAITERVASGAYAESDRLAQIERRAAELQEGLRRVESTARVEWQPAGDEADVLARYTLPDGKIAFRTVEAEIPMPGGGSVKDIRRGFFDDPYPASLPQQRAQQAMAGWAMAFLRARRNNLTPATDELCKGAWRNLAQTFRSYPGKIGEILRGALDSLSRTTGSLSGAAGIGLELISVPTIDMIRRPYDIARRIPGLFASEAAPAPQWKEPIVTGRIRGKVRGRTTDPATNYTAYRFTTSDVTLSVVNIVLNALVDPVAVADIAGILADPMGFIMGWITSGYVDTLESCILHGDTAGTHQDTLASWTMGSYYAAGEFGSDDPIRSILGLRALSFDRSTTSDASGSWTTMTDFMAAKAKMGNWSQGQLYYLCSIHHMLASLASDAGFYYQYQVGNEATLLTGEVGKYAGASVVLSQFLAAEYASTGLYTGSGSLDTSILVNPAGFSLRELAAGESDYDAAYPEKGARYVGMVRRVNFVCKSLSTEAPVATIINT